MSQVYIGAYLLVAPVTKTKLITLSQCERCGRKSNKKYCSECGGMIVSVETAKTLTMRLNYYDIPIGFNNPIVDTGISRDNHQLWIPGVRIEHAYDISEYDDDKIIDIDELNKESMIASFLAEYQDLFDYLKSEGHEPKIGCGVVSYVF